MGNCVRAGKKPIRLEEGQIHSGTGKKYLDIQNPFLASASVSKWLNDSNFDSVPEDLKEEYGKCNRLVAKKDKSTTDVEEKEEEPIIVS
ncbi:MAG: hypothetical protein QM771_08665 [Nitrospira sp.]